MLIRLLAISFCVLALHADAATQEDNDAARRAREVVLPGHYPIFSLRFTGSPSPFHETVASLIAKGAKLQPPDVVEHLWNQGLGNTNTAGFRTPIFIGSAGQPAYRFSCVTYGTCGASGMMVHLPPGARFGPPPYSAIALQRERVLGATVLGDLEGLHSAHFTSLQISRLVSALATERERVERPPTLTPGAMEKAKKSWSRTAISANGGCR
jgi:hypothetical protein